LRYVSALRVRKRLLRRGSRSRSCFLLNSEARCLCGLSLGRSGVLLVVPLRRWIRREPSCLTEISMPGFAWWKETSRVTPRAGSTVALLRDMAAGLLALICGGRRLAAVRFDRCGRWRRRLSGCLVCLMVCGRACLIWTGC
jgi:hypothetical protein